MSHLHNSLRHGRSPDFIVADDSSEQTAEGNRAMLRTLSRRFNRRIRFAGRREKERFTARVSQEAQVSPEVVDFAIFGDPRADRFTGANRNALLLDTAGTLLLTVDDDTLCHIAAPPEPQSELSYFPDNDPTEFWFFPDRDRALQSVAFVDSDILACHEGLLGSSVDDLPHAGEQTGRITMTFHGLVGDSGMASPRYYLTLTGASRDRLIAASDIYQSAFASREILRGVRRPTIAAGSFCMTTFLGLDNRFVLPPFFPVQRNSDGVFGQMVHKSVVGSHSAFLPWILVHAPRPTRRFASVDLWTAAASLRTSDIVISAMLGKEMRGEEISTEARLADLGKHLQWLGALSLNDFEEYIRTVQEFRNFGFITALYTQLQAHDATPAFWAADVRRMIELTSQTRDREDYIVPQDLWRGRDAYEARRISQELVGKFGALVEAWPAIFKAAARLCANGIRLSEPI